MPPRNLKSRAARPEAVESISLLDAIQHPCATSRPIKIACGADFLCPIASGLLLAIASNVNSLSFVAWFALVPLVAVVRKGHGYVYLGVGSLVGGLAYSLVALDWMRTADDGVALSFQRTREWFLLSEAYAISWPVIAMATRWLWRHRRISPGISFCLLWIAADYVRIVLMRMIDGTGFPYLQIAELSGVPLLAAQLGDLGGTYAVTIALVAGNACLTAILEVLWRWRTVDLRALARNAALGAMALSTVVAYGVFRQGQSATKRGPEIVAMPSTTMWDRPESMREILAAICPGVAGGSPLLVWPECAFPSSLFGTLSPEDDQENGPRRDVPTRLTSSSLDMSRASVHRRNVEQLRRWSDEFDATLVVGCVRQDFYKGHWGSYNSAMVLADVDASPKYYDKISLVPGSEGTPRFGGVFGYSRNPTYQRGTQSPVFAIGSSRAATYRFGVAICYDICFPEVFRGYFADASLPEFFVIPASEAIDRSGRLKSLLLRMARLRAIEVRRPIVRCVHEGYTCLIDANGRVSAMAEELALSAPCSLGQVPRETRTTLYSSWGDWLPRAAIGLLVILAVRRRRLDSDRSP